MTSPRVSANAQTMAPYFKPHSPTAPSPRGQSQTGAGDPTGRPAGWFAANHLNKPPISFRTLKEVVENALGQVEKLLNYEITFPNYIYGARI